MTVTGDPLTPYATAPLLVRDVANPGLISCTRQSSAGEVAELMQRGQSPVVVIREHGPAQGGDRVWGVVSSEDIVRAVAARDPRISAEALARTPVIRIRADQTVREAARVMDAAHARGLLVIDDEGQPTGWLSAADLVRVLAAGRPAPTDGRGGN